MEILFDIELYPETAINIHLLEIMFECKRELNDMLISIKNELDDVHAVFVIRMKPSDTGFDTINLKDELYKKVESLLNDFDIATIIHRISSIESN